MDFLVLWGVTQAVGFVFKPILEELAKDAAKDYVKDFFKSCLSNVLRLPEKEPLQIATGKAITEFLKLIQQELEDADLNDTTIRQYSYFIEEFIKNKQVAEILGSAFTTDSIDTKKLKQIWKQLQSKTLPNEFNWERVIKRYLKKVKAIIQETPELREILDSQNLQKLADAVPVQPDFDLNRHQEGIREKYGNLNLESLDTTGCAYNSLKLWQIFNPELFELFYDRAVNDPFERSQSPFSDLEENPRQIALEVIIKNYPNHPKTLPLLRDRALNDADEQLRKWAQKQLEKFEG
jgi:hypothetical protein